MTFYVILISSRASLVIMALVKGQRNWEVTDGISDCWHVTLVHLGKVLLVHLGGSWHGSGSS